MTRVSNLLVQDAPSPERLNQAKEWTTKGLEIVEKARQIDTTEPECERTLAVSLYNLGALLEVSQPIAYLRGYSSSCDSDARPKIQSGGAISTCPGSITHHQICRRHREC